VRAYQPPAILRSRKLERQGDCLLLGGKNSTYTGAHRPRLWVGGKSLRPQRLWLSSADHVHHTCGNGRCVLPEHHVVLPPDTHAQEHSPLTAQQASEIRADTRLLRQIAADYGISEATASRVRRGVTWANVE
jgi:hypothetical protein